MSNSENKSVGDPHTIQVPASISVRECAALKHALLEVATSAETVVIDVAALEHVDTAALQLMFAFERERAGSSLSTRWEGDSPALRNAAAALGLALGDAKP